MRNDLDKINNNIKINKNIINKLTSKNKNLNDELYKLKFKLKNTEELTLHQNKSLDDCIHEITQMEIKTESLKNQNIKNNQRTKIFMNLFNKFNNYSQNDFINHLKNLDKKLKRLEKTFVEIFKLINR